MVWFCRLLTLLFACSLFGLASAGWIADENHPLTERHVARLRSVTSVAVSPDGTWIAYTLEVPRVLETEPAGPPRSELHLTDLQGNTRAFLTGGVVVSQVQWRPDGQGISFLAQREGEPRTALYGMPVDGGEAQRLLEMSTSILEYTWRADGRQIALITEPEPKMPGGTERGLSFRPEVVDEQGAFAQIWIAEVAHGKFLAPRPFPVAGQPSDLQFSPEGARLLAAIAPSTRLDDHLLRRRLRVWDVASGQELSQIENSGKLGKALWAPDGQSIVFSGGEDSNDPIAGRLLTASAGGGAPTVLLPEFVPNIVDFSWSSAKTLQFVAEEGCLTVWGSVDATGANRTAIFGPDLPIFTDFSLTEGGAVVAFCASAPEHPAEVFVFESGQLRRLTHSNPWLEELALGRQETVRYRARDNETIEGILLYPTDFDANRRYPLIVVVHRGPGTSVPNGWVTSFVHPGQVAAGRGFFVFYPNYRGSSGRGVKFAKEHQGDFAGKELNDILDGIDHLANLGLIDNSKVGITGQGYGGFAAAWCCTFHSDRFAAGVMLSGVSDQLSLAGATDIPEELFQVHSRKRIWEDWQFFLERSPLRYVEKAHTPLLIAHGKQDQRVPFYQSLELYQQLKTLAHAPVRLLLYPQEGHRFENSVARYDFNVRLLQWFEHFLVTGGDQLPPADLDSKIDSAQDPGENRGPAGGYSGAPLTSGSF